MFSAIGVTLNGSGYYRTDSRVGGASESGKTESGKSDSGSSGTTKTAAAAFRRNTAAAAPTAS